MKVGVVSGPDGTTCSVCMVRLQLQHMEDELRGTTQTCIARSDEQSQRSCCARIVEARKFSRYINSTSINNWRELWQHRWTIHFQVHDGDFLESTSCILRNSLFSTKLYLPQLMLPPDIDTALNRYCT